ncbi:phosphoprotein phosphatase [Bifidobacterium cuniculi]|uniref:Phosphoprotein phosphatase n=2 Tax=Bifidobacterium cuniculi TaxID=1688 RepID=A0A087ATF4_9BIFI|nr:phosphoprotein phosphatase [Bifidobacterium cuniculi]
MSVASPNPNPAADRPAPLYMYSTTVSDVGTVRSNNQDSSFAGEHLVAICDGMGGHAGGDTASTIAIRSLTHIESDSINGDVARATTILETSTLAAHDAIVGKAKRERKLAGMGTTITAIALVGDWWVLAHIGDSRAYLLRDGHLMRLTSDHSYVQHLIDTKRISEAEARNHPQRNVVMRVLGDFDIDARPDISIRRAQAGDRLLLCSDGLCGVLEDSTIEETMLHFTDREECAQFLVSMALKAGSTDNVTAVIADATLALDAEAFDVPHQTPVVGGAASANLNSLADILHEPVLSAPPLVGKSSPAERAAALVQQDSAPREPSAAQTVAQPSEVREDYGEIKDTDTGEIPVVHKSDGRYSADPNDPEVAAQIREAEIAQDERAHSRRFRGRVAAICTTVVVLALVALGIWGGYAWSQNRYYVGVADGQVALYQGMPTDIFGQPLSHVVQTYPDLDVSKLPSTSQNHATTKDEAEDTIEALREQQRQDEARQQAEEEAKEQARKEAEEQAKKQQEATDKPSATKSPEAKE